MTCDTVEFVCCLWMAEGRLGRSSLAGVGKIRVLGVTCACCHRHDSESTSRYMLLVSRSIFLNCSATYSTLALPSSFLWTWRHSRRSSLTAAAIVGIVCFLLCFHSLYSRTMLSFHLLLVTMALLYECSPMLHFPYACSFAYLLE